MDTPDDSQVRHSPGQCYPPKVLRIATARDSRFLAPVTPSIAVTTADTICQLSHIASMHQPQRIIKMTFADYGRFYLLHMSIAEGILSG